MDIGFLKALAPTIVSSILGGKPEVERQVMGLLGKEPTPDSQTNLNTIIEAVNSSTPEQLTAIISLNKELTDRLVVQEQGLANARKSKGRLSGVVTVGLVLGIFILAGILCVIEIPEKNTPYVIVIMTAMIGWISQSMNFNFGSTSGSQEKSQMLYNSIPGIKF